jgi:hypothetical protein
MTNLLKKMVLGACLLVLSAGTTTARENYSWNKFKSNLDSNGIDELIQGSAFVGTFTEDDFFGSKRRDSLFVFVTGQNGLVNKCVWYGDEEGYRIDKVVHRGGTFTQANQIRLDEISVADVGAKKSRGSVIPIYNGKNGGFQTFIFHKRRWWENETGHLQKNIPAVTYELCPDFPKASKLGFGVNKNQTAKLYSELIKQHPGVRILRPDLVTDDTKVTWKRGEAEPPLTRGYWNAFSAHPCFGCGSN